MENQKRSVPSECVYLLSIVLLALAVAILTAADCGISMIVAPAYLLSLKWGVVTFGQAEYVVQAILFLMLCLVMRRCRPIYFMAFATCLIYGLVLDLWRMLPWFDPAVTPPGSMAPWVRAVMFVVGVLLTSFAVALSFKTYLYPQVYDFFVKAVSTRFGVKLSVFKTGFDISCLLIGAGLSLGFFGHMEGLGWGTLIMALINGAIIGFFARQIDRRFAIRPLFPRFARLFDFAA